MSKEFVSPNIEKNTIEELSKQLIKANGELKKLQEEREIMFANISHDLRAPMTAIRSAVDLALSDESADAEELKSALRVIDRRSKTLEALVNDMYFLYRVESSYKEEVFEEIEVVPFLEEFFYDLSLDDRYEAFNMKLKLSPDINCSIKINVQEIVRVLDNLFSNAAKYAGEGSDITLKAELEGNMLKVTVADNGHGISEEKLPFVFLRTYTVSDSRTPESLGTGSGLGLAIAKAIIEKHGGTIECKSREGEGTEFLFTLPAIVSD